MNAKVASQFGTNDPFILRLLETKMQSGWSIRLFRGPAYRGELGTVSRAMGGYRGEGNPREPVDGFYSLQPRITTNSRGTHYYAQAEICTRGTCARIKVKQTGPTSMDVIVPLE